MKKYRIILPCHFGLEAVLKREVYDLGYDIDKVEDGRVSFIGDADAVCRANIFLRTAERVLICVGSFRAVTYDELFESVKACPWEEFLPENARFWVTKASSVNSRLFSPSDIQSIVKKAMVERMKQHYDVQWFEENGADYPVRVFLIRMRLRYALIPQVSHSIREGIVPKPVKRRFRKLWRLRLLCSLRGRRTECLLILLRKRNFCN